MNWRFTLSALAAIGPMISAAALVASAAEPPYPPGTLLTVAGNGKAGSSGDGSPATMAALNNPQGLAIDAAGNLFIGGNDSAARVRKVSPDGTIATAAGTGQSGFSGDGGPAAAARLGAAIRVAVDAAGNLFIADTPNQRVRKVDPAGIIATVAGGGKPTDRLGDGGPATAARLGSPIGLAVDARGNLFIADWQTQRVRRIDSAGIITTVAGGGNPADGLGDGGLATDARLPYPYDVALDQADNLYISDPGLNRVRKVSLDGKIATVAGGGQPADGLGDGRPATDALLDGPNGITADTGGNLFIAENHGERVRKVSLTGVITTVAGTGRVGYTGAGGPATAAQLNSPISVCLDRAGNLFLTEAYRLLQSLLKSGTPNAQLLQQGNNLVREVNGVAVPQ